MASIIAGEAQRPGGWQDWWRGGSAAFAALLERERRQLPLFLPVALGAGISLWFLLPLNGERQAALLLALALALFGLFLTDTARRVVVLGGLMVALGLLAAEFRSNDVAAPRLYHWLSAAPITGTIEDVRPAAGGERLSLTLRRDATAVDSATLVRLSADARLAAGLEPGARVRVQASLGPIARPTLPGAYDPSLRAWFAGISASGRILSAAEVLAPPPAGNGWFRRLREKLGISIARGLGGDAGAVASALVVGEQGRIPPAIVEHMRVSGLAHILVVSGFHVGAVVAGAFFLFRRLLALFPALALRLSISIAAAFGAGLVGTAYVFLSGSGLPAIRSIVAAWIVLLAMMLGRDPLAPRLLAFAAFMILLLRPESLWHPSFQLSFAAVTALAALAHSGPGRRLLPRPGDSWRLKGAKFVVGLLSTSLAVELTLAPIALAQFGRTGFYGAIANLGAIPLTGFVIMPLLAAWLFLSLVGLGGLVSWALRPAINLLTGIGATVAAWPGASITLPALPEASIFALLFGAMLMLLLYGWLRFAGLPLLLLGVGLAVAAPRPDLFVDGSGRQVGIVRDGTLYTLRGHRGGFVVRSWGEEADARPTKRFADLPGAECNSLLCRVPLLGGRSLLSFLSEPPPGATLQAACAAADIVTAPAGIPQACQPRWLRLDPPALVPLGAVAIDSRRGRLDSVGLRAGDQPWSPAASPGMQPRLLGKARFRGVVVE